MSVLLPMTVGFGAGVLAWLLMSGDQDRQSFILTTILGAIAGATTALFGNAAGWFQTGDAEELAGAALGAVIALVLWAALGRRSGTVAWRYRYRRSRLGCLPYRSPPRGEAGRS